MQSALMQRQAQLAAGIRPQPASAASLPRPAPHAVPVVGTSLPSTSSAGPSSRVQVRLCQPRVSSSSSHRNARTHAHVHKRTPSRHPQAQAKRKGGGGGTMMGGRGMQMVGCASRCI